MGKNRAQGFTLIELVAVIVVLAIVASMGTSFIASSTESYIRSQQRTQLIHRSRQALERMTRQLRGALPYSLRITNANSCLEFLPVPAGANYLNEVPDQANGAPPLGNSTPIDTAPYTVEFGTARYAAIGALAVSELYGANPESLARLDADLVFGSGASAVSLNNNKRWERNSIRSRVYLLNAAWAFCLEGTDLRVYQDFDTGFPLMNFAPFNGSGVLMAENVSAVGNLFTISGGTEDFNARVIINIAFQEGGEQVTFSQEVALRNVP